MLTQQGTEKAPKWTIGGRLKDPAEVKHATPGPTGVQGPDKFPREPCYSFPGGRTSAPGRPASAPAGPRGYNPRMNPTTPKWGFGSTKRPDPFAADPGPGPGKVHEPRGGPRYSMPPRRKNNTGGPEGPGPGFYKPKRPRSAYGPRWGPEGPKPQKPQDSGPGPNYVPQAGNDGPSCSFLVNPPEKPDGNWRQLGPPWTYFGYNDFGRSDCSNCLDLPEFYTQQGDERQAAYYAAENFKEGKTVKSKGAGKGKLPSQRVSNGRTGAYTDSNGVEWMASDNSATRTDSMKKSRPVSAPASRGRRVPSGNPQADY